MGCCDDCPNVVLEDEGVGIVGVDEFSIRLIGDEVDLSSVSGFGGLKGFSDVGDDRFGVDDT